MNLTIAIFGLALLILVHEAGHFLTALAVGMRPTRFALGIGPLVAKTTRGGVEYGIGAIPLGGYVKIPGMHRPIARDADVHFAKALREAPELVGQVERLKRRLNAGEIDEAKADLDDLRRALEAASLSPDATKATRRGLMELEGSLGGEAYWRQAIWKRIAVIFAGPGINAVFAVILFAILFMIGGGKATRTVEEVLQDRPAATAGLRAGDRIVAIDGKPVAPTEIPRRIQASEGRPVRLTIERDGKRIALDPVRPRKDQGAFRLGFRLRGESLSAPEATWQSVKLSGIVTREIALSLTRLVKEEGRKEISSTVGIVQVSSQTLDEGARAYLWVLGLISLSLALFNLLPLLPLDGGHIAFSLVEGVRGRAVPREVYERVSIVGIALVLFLFAIGLTNDISRLSG
ncbi:MAG: RIP metalloprotease [Gaiellaceae bacterium]